MSTKNRRRGKRNEPPLLPFDVTQDIDPTLAESLRRSNEPTLTQVDFDDIAVELPPTPPPKRG
jgi:hypothetical protein